MTQFKAVIALTQEQKDQVMTWVKNPKTDARQNEAEPNIYLVSLSSNIDMTGQPLYSSFAFSGNSIWIQAEVTEEMYEGDTLFGLDKNIFNHIIKNQKFKPRDQHKRSFIDERIPEDNNNFIIIDWERSFWGSDLNREWYETEKIWKDRVYTKKLLDYRLLNQLKTSHLTVKEAMGYYEQGACEHHKPISIKMILEHLADDALTRAVVDMLTLTVAENKSRLERIVAFKEMS